MNQPVSDAFTQGYISKPFAKQVDLCDRNPLAELFRRLFRSHQPVLEAGCGNGRWNGWFYKNGISSDGADWSAELCRHAEAHVPASNFYVCDLRAIPVPEESYGGIISLGAIEHSKEGPREVLHEFHRVLNESGLAVITVPYGGRLRKLRRLLVDRPLLKLKAIEAIRRAFKKDIGGTPLSHARVGVNKEWSPRFLHGKEGWHFFEYEFTKGQMRSFLLESGFTILEESVIARDDGLYHNLGSLFVRWDPEEEIFSFSRMGKIVRAVIPGNWIGHMLCYVIRKNGTEFSEIRPNSKR